MQGVDPQWIYVDLGTTTTLESKVVSIMVNGNDVITYGLFVEHYQQYDVLWNGNGGRTYFFQNEIGDDQPNQVAFMNGPIRGWAAYKVADSSTTC